MPMTVTAMPQEASTLDRFRARVLTDEALQMQLGAIEDSECFIPIALGAAAACGIVLSHEEMTAALRPDPLGIERWRTPAVLQTQWPSRHWLPTLVAPAVDGHLYVDWTYFGECRLDDPFFQISTQRVMRRPFNRMCRYRMSLTHFVENAPSNESLPPSGFIYHMSRCGSTLVAQMLCAVAPNVMVSEASSLDAIVQLNGFWPNLTMSQQVSYLIAMVAALGRKRRGDERRLFIKLDSWHILALPLFRKAFASVPWVFLYREPIEVLVSQMRRRGLQMLPGGVPPRLCGIEGGETLRGEDYCARVLERICTAALDNFSLGGGLLVNYAELPDAVFTKILPHFGVALSDAERAEMAAAARRDAKAPHVEFTNDTEDKQHQATEPLRALAQQHLAGSYEKLEAMRSGSSVRADIR